MANVIIGSHPSHGYQVVEKIDSNKQLTWSDSGKLFICHQDSANDILVNLPKLQTEMCGWHAKLILRTSSGKDIQVNSFGQPIDGGLDAASSDYQKMLFLEIATKDTGASTRNNTASGFMFDESGTEEIGANVEVWTDGDKWFALGFDSTNGSSLAAIS